MKERYGNDFVVLFKFRSYGVDAPLRGWLLAGLPDEALERHGLALFDGLYAVLSDKSHAKAQRTQRN